MHHWHRRPVAPGAQQVIVLPAPKARRPVRVSHKPLEDKHVALLTHHAVSLVANAHDVHDAPRNEHDEG